MNKLTTSMKLKIFLFFCLVFATAINAQIPYFSSTAGDGNLYGYTSLKFRPGVNEQETYSCFQYGIGNNFSAGSDISTGAGCAYWGALVRVGKVVNPYLGLGVQVSPSFNLNDNFKYSYTTAALYMNGQITKDGKLFWCSNTWWGINKNAENTITNWEYLGYTFGLSNGRSITPMFGCIHSWNFNQNADLAIGAYYSFGNWNLYIWANDLTNNTPRVVIGIDFKLPTMK